MNTKNLLITAAIAAVVVIAMDYVLPLKQEEQGGNLKRI